MPYGAGRGQHQHIARLELLPKALMDNPLALQLYLLSHQRRNGIYRGRDTAVFSC